MQWMKPCHTLVLSLFRGRYTELTTIFTVSTQSKRGASKLDVVRVHVVSEKGRRTDRKKIHSDGKISQFVHIPIKNPLDQSKGSFSLQEKLLHFLIDASHFVSVSMGKRGIVYCSREQIMLTYLIPNGKTIPLK